LQGRLWVAANGMLEAKLPKEPLISIVEDDRFVRESIRRLMRSLGYTVAVFPSATDFLESPHLGETACLIADVHMPAMTGAQLYGRLTEQGHAIPTILITAYPDDVVRARVLNDGVVCYLRKPFGDDDLYVVFIRLSAVLGRPKKILELIFPRARTMRPEVGCHEQLSEDVCREWSRSSNHGPAHRR
jgi:CheY-like chemotaxis protein